MANNFVPEPDPDLVFGGLPGAIRIAAVSG